MNFLYENNLLKDLKSKIKISCKLRSKPWFTIQLFLITGPWEDLHSSKLNSANWIIRKYWKLHIKVCFPRFSQIQLQQLFRGKESIVLKSLPAEVVLSYFTESERKICLQKENKNNEIKKEKKLWLLLLEQQKNDWSSLFFSSKLAGLL